MPYNRPGNIHVDATATKVTLHGAPCIEEKIPGVAVKTVAPGATAALVTPASIAISEKFNIICKGVVQITNPAGAFARGGPVYITESDNSLASTSGAGKVKYGVVVEVAGERGCPTGMMRVNLDLKDTL